MRRNILALAGWLAVCYAAAAIGSLFNLEAIPTWYPTLAKPSWTPPSWLFGPVWTALYTMMAVAAWLVWRRRGTHDTRLALTLFGVQLALNVAWSGLFFGLRRPELALAEIALLWLAILATLLACWRVSRAAGWLLLPYLLWVSFASALNLAIVRLN